MKNKLSDFLKELWKDSRVGLIVGIVFVLVVMPPFILVEDFLKDRALFQLARTQLSGDLMPWEQQLGFLEWISVFMLLLTGVVIVLLLVRWAIKSVKHKTN